MSNLPYVTLARRSKAVIYTNRSAAGRRLVLTATRCYYRSTEIRSRESAGKINETQMAVDQVGKGERSVQNQGFSLTQAVEEH